MTKVYTLITGGSAGIGRSLAFECARRKQDLLLVALPGHELEETAGKIKTEFNVDVQWLGVDLAQNEGPKKVCDWCLANNFRVNFLINNAGIAGSESFESSDPDYSDLRIMLNIRSLVLLTRYMLPLMRQTLPGKILNLGSLSGYFCIPYKSVYSASKAFVISFSKSLRLELEGSGIQVFVLNPNGVESNTTSRARIDTHGFFGKMVKIDSDRLAKLTLDKIDKNHHVIIPLFINRLLLILNRLLPKKMTGRILMREFRKELKYRNP